MAKPVKKPVKKPVAKNTKKAEVITSSKNSLVLKEILDISYSERFVDEISNFVSKSGNQIVLDAGNVSKITTPCVQVLLAVFLKCYQENISLKINNISNNFKLAFQDLGLECELNKYLTH